MELRPEPQGPGSHSPRRRGLLRIRVQVMTQQNLGVLDTLIGCLFVLTSVPFSNQRLWFVPARIRPRRASRSCTRAHGPVPESLGWAGLRACHALGGGRGLSLTLAGAFGCGSHPQRLLLYGDLRAIRPFIYLLFIFNNTGPFRV